MFNVHAIQNTLVLLYLQILYYLQCGEIYVENLHKPKSTITSDNKEYKTSTNHTVLFFSYIYGEPQSAGKNAKLPGYMDYLHLSTADVAILKGSWSVLEEHVTRVSTAESHPTNLSWAEKPMEMVKSQWKSWKDGGKDEKPMEKAEKSMEKSWKPDEQKTFQVGVDFFIDMMTNHEEIKAVFRQVFHHDRHAVSRYVVFHHIISYHMWYSIMTDVWYQDGTWDDDEDHNEVIVT